MERWQIVFTENGENWSELEHWKIAIVIKQNPRFWDGCGAYGQIRVPEVIVVCLILLSSFKF